MFTFRAKTQISSRNSITNGINLYIYIYYLNLFFPEKEKVAFSASLSVLEDGFQFIGPYTYANTLVYKNTFSNIGNAYDTNTGK